MLHPDEGTIHSWLDGALPADEAARIEAHVTTCVPCQAAVAEARGFIAASSRILTALDDVPSGVIPATTVVRMRPTSTRHVWRAAAAVLVIVTGSLMVFRSNTREKRIVATGNDSAGSIAASAPPSGNSPAADRANSPTSAPAVVAAAIPAATPAPAVAPKQRSSTPTLALQTTRVPEAASDFSGKAVHGGAVTTGVASVPAVPSQMRVAANPATVGADLESPPLKVVSSERIAGGRRTIFDVEPSRRVTLNEIEQPRLSAVVTTGAPSAPPPQASQPAPGQERTRAVSAGAAASANGATTNTIRWTDSATKKLMVLSGQFTVEELQRIRARIETRQADSLKKE